MRVVYWTEFFWPYIGGIQVLASRTLPALRSRGYEFTVVTSHGSLDLPDNAEHCGISVSRFPFLQALADRDAAQILRLNRRAAELMRAFQPDLIHLNFSGPSMLFCFRTLDAYPAPLLVALRGELASDCAPDTLVAHAARSAQWFTAVSASVLQRAREVIPAITERSSLIYNGFPEPAVEPAPLPFDPPRLLCVGRLVGEKGIDLAVQSMAHLRQSYPAAELVIAGDGPMRGELERQAERLGMSEAVTFVGWVAPEEVAARINSATIVVVPSRTEGLPGVAIQAAQLARPVVATSVGGAAEVVVHNETGLLVAAENSTALAGAVRLLLDQPAVAVEMGRAARHRARRMFGWETYLDAYDRLYQRLGGRGASAG
jgi:glycogen synthase